MYISYNKKTISITLDIPITCKEDLKNIKKKVDVNCFIMRPIYQKKQLEIENEGLNITAVLGERLEKELAVYDSLEGGVLKNYSRFTP